ncbi:MAG TPA: hypothetical protein VFZ61_06810, partial [Polyangiales bacterium]
MYVDDAGDDAGDDGGPAGDATSPAPNCEEPSCLTPPQMDGGADADEPMLDSGGDAEPLTAPEAGLDPARSAWVGRYATRSFLFAQDTPLETTGRFLTLAEIKPGSDGGLVLEEELCLFDGEWVFVVKGRLRVAFPGTRASSTLTYTEDMFSSAQAKARIGYE